MNHMASGFSLMPVSNLAFRKSPAAGQSNGNLVREKGKGHKLGPPGIHTGIAPMGGAQEMASEWQKEDDTTAPVSIDRAMDTLNDSLKLMGDNSERSEAIITETIKMCKVSESYKARNSKNRNPNEDEQEFWEEGSGKIQIGIN
eukprot:2889780-Pyramimonas_sp.AAC.1